MSVSSSRVSVASREKSGGGMLMGIFAGLLLGLVIAVGVLVYVNFAPSPFKEPPLAIPPQGQGKTTADTPRAAPPQPQPAPTAGGTEIAPPEAQAPELAPPRPATPSGDSKPVDPKVPDQKTQQADVKPARPSQDDAPELKPPVAVKQAPSAKPDGAGKAASSGSRNEVVAGAKNDSPAPKPTPVLNTKYWLQIGAFSDPTHVEDVKARLALDGLEARTFKITHPSKGELIVVRVGPFKSSDDAEKTKANMNMSATVVKTGG